MSINENNQLLITREEVLKVGINENTFDKAVVRNTVLVAERGNYLYNSLNKEWQKLVENTLCGGGDA